MEIVFLVIGVVLGLVVGYLIAKLQKGVPSNIKNEIETLKKQNQEYQQINITLDKEKEVLSDRLTNSVQHFNEQKEKIKTLESDNLNLSSSLTEWKTNYNNLDKKLQEQKQELEQMQEKFKVEFENIANKILEEKSTKFVAQNQKSLDQLLNPFNEKLKDFSQKVEDTYVKGLTERTKLSEQILNLTDLNQQMRQDAQNLTNALKNDNKTQGNWGEFILERILEESGLKEGVEYKKQVSTVNEEGKRIQPDIVIQLPDEKHIIVDSKVSLVAYEQYVNEGDLVEKEKHLNNHVISVKNHIKGLSEKSYQTSSDLHTPDFVLLFMPIEPAFSAAIQKESDLYKYAWDRRIVIVSPTTLLATLRTIASIWRQERQNKNVLEIARQAGALHDKFVGFLEDMEKINKSIASSQAAYLSAMNKLKEGRGNLISSTNKIRKLGAKAQKQIPNDYLDNQIEE